MLLLPIDHGLEHGPRDFIDNPDSADPSFQLRLAVDGDYSGLACHIGLVERFVREYAGRVPLVLKVNGKTNIPPDDEAFSPLTASVEDAARLAADAIGYTLFVGSPAQDRDFEQFRQVRREAEQLGMPIIVWAYPRGRHVEEKGGRDSPYAVEYGARVAVELGADAIKVNVPVLDDRRSRMPKPYNTMELTEEEAIRRVVQIAPRTPVLFSGGSKLGDEDLLLKARLTMEAGAAGLIFGRNIWQRPYKQALAITEKIVQIMKEA